MRNKRRTDQRSSKSIHRTTCDEGWRKTHQFSSIAYRYRIFIPPVAVQKTHGSRVSAPQLPEWCTFTATESIFFI